jgi:Ca2+-binding EF-hand superfamily protein
LRRDIFTKQHIPLRDKQYSQSYNMKTTTFALLALSAALLPFSLQAQSDNADGNGQDRQGPPSLEQILERMDTDDNGMISKEEAKGPLSKRFDKIDLNSDGQLSPKELMSLKKKGDKPEQAGAEGRGGPQGRESGQKLKEADTDENGTLSKDEVTAAGLEKILENFDKIDSNSDGELDREEMRAMLKHAKQHREGQAAEVEE